MLRPDVALLLLLSLVACRPSSYSERSEQNQAVSAALEQVYDIESRISMGFLLRNVDERQAIQIEGIRSR